MEHLWAPWRSQYIEKSSQEGKHDKGCIFCIYPAQETKNYSDSFILYCDEQVFVMMNLYPYNPGHLMIVPRKHMADPTLLEPKEFIALCNLLKQTMMLIRTHFRPEGINVGMNLGKAGGAGIEEHCHFHVVPRWSGDTNFMPVIGGTKVINNSLSEIYQALLPKFQQIIVKK